MPRLPLRTAALAALLALPACSHRRPASAEMQVFAAASLRESLEEIAAGFTRSTGVRVSFNFAGSNDLAQQIRAARGMDLFLSASERWMDAVDSAGRVEPGSRRDLLGNRLVVVSRRDAPFRLSSPCELPTLGFTHLALADPAAVPAGIYAREWLGGTRCAGGPLWAALEARVAPAPDVRAALGLVLADPRVVGVVYRSDQLAFAGRVRVLLAADPGPAIRYPVALLREGRNPGGARRFQQYLSSPTAAAVFRRRGFAPLPAAR